MKPTDSPPPPHGAPAGHAEPGPNFPYDELHNDDVAHEPSDVNIRAVVMSAVAVGVVCLATAGLMYVLFWSVFDLRARERDPRMSPLAMPPTSMPPNTLTSPEFGGAPSPRLLTNEPVNLRQIREQERTQLGAYGWVDEKGGVTRIPLEEAKKLVLERGLPVRPDPITDPRVGTHAPAFGESSSGRTITQPPAAEAQPPAAPAHAPAPASPPPAHKEH